MVRVVPKGACLLVVLALSGCAATLTEDPAHPERPDIGALRISTKRTMSGCPVSIRVSYADAQGDVARARAFWSYSGLSEGPRPIMIIQDGFAAVVPARDGLGGSRAGDIEIVLTPLQPGQYRYTVQVEDAGGRRSNVLEDSFTVVSAPASGSVTCAGSVPTP
ncbi:MAG: hypothetical protein ACREKS_12545 [Candidatus Rokuibacteriota bacterium]